MVSNTNNHILSWKSKGLFDESIKPPSTSSNIPNPLLNYVGTKTRVEFKGSCLKQDRFSFDHGKVVNIYAFYEINRNFEIDSYSTPKNCLFGAVKLTKHPDIDKYKYSRYGIRFDRKGFFSLGNEIGRNVTVFGVDMSSSSHIDNKKKDTLILGKRPTQGLEHTLTAEKLYSINFMKHNTKFCLSWHYNGANIYLFVNGTEIIKFKAKDSEIVASPLCLGKISKGLSLDNMKKTRLNEYVYDFSVDYNAIAVANILDIHKYLMKKNGIV